MAIDPNGIQLIAAQRQLIAELADATLVYLAERESIEHVFTST
jgi:predicted nucleic acid-binding protein